jgi:hypothetical protein
MHKGLLWGAAAALSLSAPAFADGFDYSYLDLGYINTQFDDGGGSSDGFGLRGSFALTDQLHLIGSYSKEDLDFNIDLDTYTIGAGLNWPLSPNLDIDSTLAYIHQKADFGNFGSIDDDGVQIGLGLRGRVAQQLELTGQLTYTNFDGSGDDTSPTFGLRYYPNDKFAIVGDVTLFDGGNQYFVGGRLNLGK